jgi:hypothetical protein
MGYDFAKAEVIGASGKPEPVGSTLEPVMKIVSLDTEIRVLEERLGMAGSSYEEYNTKLQILELVTEQTMMVDVLDERQRQSLEEFLR